jgi:hypothetical protein
MKIWWPWRRKKPRSLFEERVQWLGEAPDAKPSVLLSDGPSHQGRHPLNASGPFYVGDGECISCGVPHVVAPDSMAWESNPNDPHVHCYFKKQPVEPWELKQALAAIDASCCGAIYYAGSDREVLEAIRKSGNKHAIVKARG